METDIAVDGGGHLLRTHTRCTSSCVVACAQSYRSYSFWLARPKILDGPEHDLLHRNGTNDHEQPRSVQPGSTRSNRGKARPDTNWTFGRTFRWTNPKTGQERSTLSIMVNPVKDGGPLATLDLDWRDISFPYINACVLRDLPYLVDTYDPVLHKRKTAKKTAFVVVARSSRSSLVSQLPSTCVRWRMVGSISFFVRVLSER